jgi:hypothetical protein
MTPPRPSRNFRKRPQGPKSWAAPNVVWPSLADSRKGEFTKLEPGESSAGNKVGIVGFRKRNVTQRKASWISRTHSTDLGTVISASPTFASPEISTSYEPNPLYRLNSDIQKSALDLPDFRLALNDARLNESVSSKFKQIIDTLVERKVTELLAVTALGSSDRLQDARARGNAYKAAELVKPENAQLKEASVYSGTSDRVINKWRNEGLVYALVQEGKSRGFRYPLWQFDADRDRLSRVLQVLRDVKASDWVIHNFLLRPNSLLDGRSPREWICDPSSDMERLFKVVGERFAGDQGAS